MASIREVAKRAGVSITTVSKALNNYADVNPDTRQRVLDICRQMDYKPNPSARSLASKRSNNISLLISDIKETDANGNIIFRLLVGAQSACNKRGYELSIIFTDAERQRRKSFDELSRERNLCGSIIYGLKITDPYYGELAKQEIPCVAIDVEDETGGVVTVSTNNRKAVAEVVEMLHSRGHRNIAMMNGAQDARISYVREGAFRQAMAALGLPVAEGMVRYANFFEQDAYNETHVLLAEHPEVDAVFAASDLMAMGVMRAAGKLGRRIPADLAVVGFDGIQVGEFISPPLATVCQNFKTMGKAAANIVMDMAEGKTCPPLTYVPHELVTRKSV